MIAVKLNSVCAHVQAPFFSSFGEKYNLLDGLSFPSQKNICLTICIPICDAYIIQNLVRRNNSAPVCREVLCALRRTAYTCDR